MVTVAVGSLLVKTHMRQNFQAISSGCYHPFSFSLRGLWTFIWIARFDRWSSSGILVTAMVVKFHVPLVRSHERLIPGLLCRLFPFCSQGTRGVFTVAVNILSVKTHMRQNFQAISSGCYHPFSFQSMFFWLADL